VASAGDVDDDARPPVRGAQGSESREGRGCQLQ
jgi:hypothetical protein